MINLLIPLTKQNTSCEKIFEIVKNSNYKNEIVVRFLCEKNNPILQKKLKTKLPHTFDIFPQNTSEDSMIFATTKALEVEELLIVKEDCKFFSTATLDKLIEAGRNDKDIVLFKSKKHKNKVKKWFLNQFQKVCNTFFNFNFFDGDLGCMYFSARAHNILQETNVTAMTKINRWTSIEIEYIEENIPKTKISEKPPKIIPLKFLMYFAILIGSIVGTIFLGVYGFLTMLLIIVFVCLVTSLIVMMSYMILKWICFKKIGNIYSEKVEIIERRASG